MVPELAQSPLLIYLYEEDSILVAGEFVMEWPEDGADKIIVEALLKSPDENDAGFIMLEAKR